MVKKNLFGIFNKNLWLGFTFFRHTNIRIWIHIKSNSLFANYLDGNLFSLFFFVEYFIRRLQKAWN